MASAKLVPELYCSDMDRSLRFYTEVLGFSVRYARPEARFAYLEREGAEIMIEAPGDPRRTWLTGELTRPFGRGINLQIEVGDVDALLARVSAAGVLLFWPLEERWYRRDHEEVGNRQFLVQDPDGYLLRFFQDLGQRPASGASSRGT
ncbi:MAG: VOC family protein [Alphaproteobacteria bacterium]|nr:VOC family protein [Alphaproteobacteria bacterium]